MAKIRVHVLNFHSIWSHIEIVLQNTSTEPNTYYGINRWDYPCMFWEEKGPRQYIGNASSVFSFDIEAKPDKITEEWEKYWQNTKEDASILGNNCAVAAQWFLTKFAGIPKPNHSNVSWNHLALGIVWPSFLGCPVTLPGRIMSNAKFYIEARNNPEKVHEYSRVFLYTCMALATLTLAASIFMLAACITLLSTLIAPLAITACAAGIIASTYAFFKAYNKLSAKTINDKLSKSESPDLLPVNKEGESVKGEKIDGERQQNIDFSVSELGLIQN